MGTSQPTTSPLAVAGAALTRRSLLRAFAAGGVLLSGGATLSACQRNTGGGGGRGSADVTLKIGGVPNADPYPVMPSAATQKKDPNAKGYAEALQSWLDDNPGVKLNHINADIQDTEALVAAVGGGTAPDLFIGNVLGSWGTGDIRNAFVQGLAADITELAEQYGFGEKLNPVVKPAWDFWAVEGKRYALPYEYSGAGQGLYYRKDFLATADIDDIAFDQTWTWSKVREIAKATTQGKRKGIGLVSWNYWAPLSANAHGLLTQLPAPDQNWNWRSDFTTHADTWVRAIELFRGMVYTDESVMTDISLEDTAVVDAFGRAEIGMWMGNPAALTHAPSDPAVSEFVTLDNTSYEEVVGWIPLPYGDLGFFDGSSRYTAALISFRPDADEDVLDKAVSLHTYMMGPGLTKQMTVINDETKDLRNVYGGYVAGSMIPTNTMIPVFAESIEDLPGSPEEAWGQRIVDAYSSGTKLAPTPPEELFFPAEENPGPPSTASDDALNRWAFEKKTVDIRSDLAKLERTLNKTNEGFSSSIEDETFKESARKYYQELDTVWAKEAPEFHSQVYAPWYQEKVLPALG
jgi:hypothetical protein